MLTQLYHVLIHYCCVLIINIQWYFENALRAHRKANINNIFHVELQKIFNFANASQKGDGRTTWLLVLSQSQSKIEIFFVRLFSHLPCLRLLLQTKFCSCLISQFDSLENMRKCIINKCEFSAINIQIMIDHSKIYRRLLLLLPLFYYECIICISDIHQRLTTIVLNNMHITTYQ